MFAMQPKGLFGQRRKNGQGILPGDQPDYGMGGFPGVPQGVPMPHNLPQNANAGRKRGGLFGSGVPAGDVLYALGGALAGDGGAAVSEIRERKMAPLIEQAKRQAEYEDFVRKEQWKRDNPAPVNNDTVADYEFIRQRLGEEDAQKYLKNKASPPLWRQGPDGQFYPMATPQVPTAPVGKLTPITGGAATPAQPPFGGSGFIPPQRLKSGAMTSGRRTPEGNIAVGGVRNSKHLTGEAVDYDGPDLNAVLAEARALPGVRRAFIHKGHVHTEGDGWAAPYYGKNGTRGLNR